MDSIYIDLHTVGNKPGEGYCEGPTISIPVMIPPVVCDGADHHSIVYVPGAGEHQIWESRAVVCRLINARLGDLNHSREEPTDSDDLDLAHERGFKDGERAGGEPSEPSERTVNDLDLTAPAYRIACPYQRGDFTCPAVAGEPCRTSSGAIREEPHAAREDAAPE